MYEPILLAKVREPRTITLKPGDWIILGNPDQPLSASIEQRAKLVKNGNVSDEFSALLIGRLQDTHTPTKFVTTAEAKKAQELHQSHQESLAQSHQDALKREKTRAKDDQKTREQQHRERVEAINAENDAIRNRGTGSADVSSALEPEEHETENLEPETVPANEFNREELLTKNQGELLAIVDGLVAAGRITKPAKTSPSKLVKAILAAKPLPPTP